MATERAAGAAVITLGWRRRVANSRFLISSSFPEPGGAGCADSLAQTAVARMKAIKGLVLIKLMGLGRGPCSPHSLPRCNWDRSPFETSFIGDPCQPGRRLVPP